MHTHRKIRAREVRRCWFLGAVWLLLIFAATTALHAKHRDDTGKTSLQHYLSSISGPDAVVTTGSTLGSLWRDDAPFSSLASDAKARRLHDLITIAVSEQTLAQAAGDVTSQRDYSGSSAVTALGGHIGTGGVNPLFGANSSTSLKGKGQADSNSTLQTTLGAEVVAIFPNGNMVVEARRSVNMNNEHRTIILRGVVRRSDINSNNIVSSTALAHLEIELKGKGVVSDGTRPNNVGIRWLWKILGF